MRHIGFTLIELLVVIATIVLILAIVLPSLQSSREQAKAILCGSNIKHLVLGLAMYETENENFPQAFDDTLLEPPPGGYPGYFQYDRPGWWWFNHIIDYSRKDSGSDSVIWCPSRQINNSKLKSNILCGNYGVNQSICKSARGRKSHAEFIGTPLRSSDIQRPAETLLIVDSGYSMINWWHATDAPPSPLGSTIEDTAYIPGLWVNKEKELWPGQEWDAIAGRHPNRTVNVGFSDWHIDIVEAANLFVEKTGGAYKNKSPLWQPK